MMDYTYYRSLSSYSPSRDLFAILILIELSLAHCFLSELGFPALIIKIDLAWYFFFKLCSHALIETFLLHLLLDLFYLHSPSPFLSGHSWIALYRIQSLCWWVLLTCTCTSSSPELLLLCSITFSLIYLSQLFLPLISGWSRTLLLLFSGRSGASCLLVSI